MRRCLPVVFSTLVLLASCFAQDDHAAMGSIRGEVVTRNQNGEPAVLPDARIVLHGPINKEAQSGASGAFAIDGLPPGLYEIEATAPGLNAAIAVEVKPGVASAVRIELSVATVTDTVTVAANDAPAIEESAQKSTINQSTVEAAPNQNEKIESLLPLVPGVVRGPDGRINMKGAQATQAGWLVNSANVTDPATGGQAINLPIDVVSSVQVITNPYDPEYGKFTGAIASVETRTGNA
ncbi:MAG TPA: carboxypeptidase regulatory-like domain-containing protein, partial [Terriglobales bacterium]|nr:carboxypeptidase regulatory-like domain-containing protein [Terriglobales bacterium]